MRNSRRSRIGARCVLVSFFVVNAALVFAAPQNDKAKAKSESVAGQGEARREKRTQKQKKSEKASSQVGEQARLPQPAALKLIQLTDAQMSTIQGGFPDTWWNRLVIFNYNECLFTRTVNGDSGQAARVNCRDILGNLEW